MDEIEKFLREAAARRRQTQGQQPPPPPQTEIQYVEPQIVEAESVAESLSSVSDRHIDASSKFEQRSTQMSSRAKMADSLLQQQMHQKFDHELGRLGDAKSRIAAEKASAAGRVRPSQGQGQLARSLMHMLRTPQTLRSAILLKEILERPEQRWE